MTITPALPMPGEAIGPDIVAASCWVIDDQGHDAERAGDDGRYRATVVTIRSNTDGAGYYGVVEIVDDLDGGWLRDDEVVFPNIVPAAAHYRELTQ